MIGNIWGDFGGIDTDDNLVGDTPYTVGGPTGAKDNFPFYDDGNDVAPVILSTGLPAFCGVAAPLFALDLVETYIDEIWVSYNGGATNYSCSAEGMLPQWSSLGNGTFTISFWANDTDNYVGTIAALLHKDILAPTLAVPSPAAGTSFTEVPMFTVTVEDAQLNLTWYTIGSDTAKHYFTGTTFTIDTDAWTDLPAGEITIHIYANDTLGNIKSLPIIITKMVTNNLGWLWIVVIGTIIGVVLVFLVMRIRKKKRNHSM